MVHVSTGVLSVVNFIRFNNMISFVDMVSIKENKEDKDEKKTNVLLLLAIIKELRALGWTCHNNHRGALSWYRVGNYNKNIKYATQDSMEWKVALKTAVEKAAPF